MRADENAIKELINKSFEETLSTEEKLILDEALSTSEVWQKEYGELKKIRGVLADYSIAEEDRWSIDEIGGIVSIAMKKRGARFFNLGRHWTKIAVACVITLVISLGSVYIQNGSLNADTLVGIEEVEAEEAYTYLSTNYAYDE